MGARPKSTGPVNYMCESNYAAEGTGRELSLRQEGSAESPCHRIVLGMAAHSPARDRIYGSSS